MVLILVIKPPAFLPPSVNLLAVAFAASAASSKTPPILDIPILLRKPLTPFIARPVSPVAFSTFLVYFSWVLRELICCLSNPSFLPRVPWISLRALSSFSDRAPAFSLANNCFCWNFKFSASILVLVINDVICLEDNSLRPFWEFDNWSAMDANLLKLFIELPDRSFVFLSSPTTELQVSLIPSTLWFKSSRFSLATSNNWFTTPKFSTVPSRSKSLSWPNLSFFLLSSSRSLLNFFNSSPSNLAIVVLCYML